MIKQTSNRTDISGLSFSEQNSANWMGSISVLEDDLWQGRNKMRIQEQEAGAEEFTSSMVKVV